MAICEHLISTAENLRDAVHKLTFTPPVTHVYNPLDYAWEAHQLYLERFGNSKKRVIMLGMNPGGCVPFCHFHLKRSFPAPYPFPQSLDNIGDHIRKRRLELNQCQKVTATLIGVSEDTLRDWELGRQHPRAKNIPEIIEFLGYDPDLPPQNVAGLIARERKRRGLSIAAMASQTGVSDDTLRNWEEGRYLPMKRGYEKLMEFAYSSHEGFPAPEAR